MYNDFYMSTLLEQAIERLRELPQTEQDLAAADLMRFVSVIDASPIQLSDEQVAEVERRRAVKNPRTLTAAQLDARLNRYGI
jgi:hypothetical protein